MGGIPFLFVLFVFSFSSVLSSFFLSFSSSFFFFPFSSLSSQCLNIKAHVNHELVADIVYCACTLTSCIDLEPGDSVAKGCRHYGWRTYYYYVAHAPKQADAREGQTVIRWLG